MNSVAGIYPHTLTFARGEVRIKPVVTRWALDVKQPRRLPTPLDGLDVFEFVGAMATGLLNEFFKESACKP